MIRLVLVLAVRAALRTRPRACTCCTTHHAPDRPDVRGAVPR